MIHVRLLGTLDLRDSEGAELRSILAQPKRTALLAYLAVATSHGFHRRDTLLPLFWPELDEAHARNALSKAVHHLRRSLGDGMLVSRGDEEIGLCTERMWCDVVAFDHAFKEGRIAEALELYKGDVLEGFHLSDAPEFERWLERERERLVRSWAQAVTAAAEEQEAAGDYAAGSDQWRRLTARDPFNSRTVLRLMQALAASGDRAGALRQANVHGALLKEEFDAEADPEVEALAQRLRDEPGVIPNGWRASPGQLVSTGSAVVDSLESRPLAEQPTEPEVLPPVVDTDASPATSVPSSAPDPRIPMPRNWRWSATVALAAAIVLLLVVGLRNETWRGWIGQGSDAPPPAISSIAVLPLENLSGDPEQEYFADGMTDALITELAGIGQIRVTSRTSVMRYKNSSKPLPEIARELKVDAVVQGAVLRDGNRVRITAQLVRAPKDEHLWAESYERNLRDILALQGEVAAAIARRVHARVAARSGKAVVRSVDPLAYELYMKGRHFWSKSSPEEIRKGIEYFRRAIDADPLYAPAYSGLADAYTRLSDDGHLPADEAHTKGMAAAEKAIALDAQLAEAHVSRAHILMHQWHWAEAERGYRRALELNPSDATARLWYAVHLMITGRAEESLRQARYARQLDPLSPGLNLIAGMVLFSARRYEEALEAYRSTLELAPEHPGAIARIGRLLIEAGRYDEGFHELRRLNWSPASLSPALLSVERLYTVRALALSGSPAAARDTLHAVLSETTREGYNFAGYVALAYAAFGERDRAFEYLQTLVPKKSNMLFELRSPPFDSLRSDPRFAELLRQMGLE